MSQYATLKAAITAAIKQNGNNEITGNLLQQQLLAMVNSLGDGFQFIGIATPSTNPGTPDQNVFYIASEAGTYSNFSGIVVAENEIAILKWNGTWAKETTGAATAAQLNQLGQKVYNFAQQRPQIEGANETLIPYQEGISGFINRNDGSLNYADVGDYKLDFIAVKPKQILLLNYSNNTLSAGMYGFYGIDGTILTPDPIDGNQGNVSYLVVVPDGASCLVVGYDSTQPKNYQLLSGVSATENVDNGIASFSLYGFINRDTGVITPTYLNGGYSDYVIKVKKGDMLKVKYNSYNALSAGQYNFYDKEFEPINSSAPDGDGLEHTLIIEVPNNAEYFAFCADNSKAYYIYLATNDVDKKALKIESELSKPASYKFINRHTGVRSDTTDLNSGVPLFVVDKYKKVLVKFTSYNSIYAGQYNFYDLELNPINSSAPDGDGLEHEMLLDVPSGAVYIGLGVDMTKSYECADFDIADKLFVRGAEQADYSNTRQELSSDAIVISQDTYIKTDYVIRASFELSAAISQNIEIWKGTGNTYKYGYFYINSANVLMHDYEHDETIAHGLTIADWLDVIIDVDKWGKATMYLYTNGGQAKLEFTNRFYANGQLRFKGISDCLITSAGITYRGLNQILPRIYGDSSCALQDDRWVYYILQSGGEALINSLPGGKSEHLYPQIAIDKQLGGEPSMLIWAMGTNDGGDPDLNTPNATWLSYIKKVISSVSPNTQLVLFTRATCRGFQNHAKNEWVRNSGYRYVDLASAVQPDDTSDVWYTGMVSEDGIHPTPHGARALASMIMAKIPELISKK